MDIWYAQAGNVNINRVSGGTTSNVWNAAPDGSGAWMDVSVLISGVAVILCANAKTLIHLNISLDIGTGRLSTAAEGTGAAGGSFDAVGAGVTITANLLAGTTTCVPDASNSSWTLNGNVTAGTSTSAHGINKTGTGTVTINNGTIQGGAGATAMALRNGSTGTFALVNCAVVGGAGGVGINNTTTGNITMNGGSVAGGTAANVYGLTNSTGGVSLLNVTLEGGSAAGANALYCSNVGIVTIGAGVKILQTAGKALAIGGLVSFYYQPGAADYVRMPSGAGTTADYPLGLTAANIKDGVQSGTQLGTWGPAPAAGDVRDGATILGVPGSWGPPPDPSIIKHDEIVNSVTGEYWGEGSVSIEG